jgi:hypothetical protein
MAGLVVSNLDGYLLLRIILRHGILGLKVNSLVYFGFPTTCTFLIGKYQMCFYKIGKILYSILDRFICGFEEGFY